MSQATRSPTWEAALEYATRFGWHVFPVEPAVPGNSESGKRPLTDVALGLVYGKDGATVDPARIDEVWSKYPNANVGIACEPSGLCVLDVDVGPTKAGRASLAELEQAIELPLTLTAITGGGGLHAVYRADQGPALQRLGFKPGLDLIGKGYVVAAPSIHWTGKPYAWRDVRTPARLPEGLRNIAAARPEKVQLNGSSLERGAIPPGGRNIALFRLGAALRDSGIGKEALASALHHENKQRCQPPLADDELRLIVESVLKRVQPTRDVAAGAVVHAEIQAMYQAPPRSAWVGEIARQKQPPMRFYSTGFDQLDVLLGGGIATRQVCGVIGPPSAGKSAFIGSVVERLQQQLPVLLCSTELPAFELMIRFACARIGIPWREGVKGLVPDEKLEEVTRDMRVRLIGSETLDRTDPLGMLRAEATALREQTGVAPVVVVDYVQMLARGSDETRTAVGQLSMGLRVLAQDLDCPVVAVFSSRRDFYGTDRAAALREQNDPTAYLVAAKESGDIEFDCATLLYLDVDKLHEGQPKPARLVVARCRVGDIGFVGARAALDVGKWWGDAAAAGELATDTKREARVMATAEKDALRVYELVQRMPGRPWRDIRVATGLGKRADAARAKLLEMGKLELVRETTYDALHRQQTREVLRIVEQTSENGNTASPTSAP